MKIYVGSPVYRDVVVEHHDSIWKLQALVNKRPDIELVKATVRGDADVGRARNIAASSFLKSDADVMLTIDGDIMFHAEEALKLCQKCMNGYDIIGALYMTRGLQNVQPAQLIGKGQQVTLQPGEKPIGVKYLATGFMAVHRKVFKKLTKHPEVKLCMQSTAHPFYTFYLQKTIPWPNDKNLYLSEDYAFCDRAAEMGFKVYLDPTIRLGHIGHYAYRLEDMVEVHIKPCPIRLTSGDDGMKVEALLEKGDEGLLNEYRGRVGSEHLVR